MLARGAQPLVRRDLDAVHLPFDTARAPARTRLARLPPLPGVRLDVRLGLLGLVDLAIQRRVLVGLRVRVDGGRRAGVADERLEE